MHRRVLYAGLAAILASARIPTFGADPTNIGQPLPAVTIGGTTFDLVRIPPGEFLMGSEKDLEKPRHQVRIRSFDLGRTEVTVRQFRAFTAATGYRTDAEKEGSAWVCRGSNDDAVGWRSRGYWTTEDAASWRNPGFSQSDDHPVVTVSWSDAVEFCRWLSRETGDQYRLPSEAEWEYAARAGNQAERPSDLNQVAWYKVNSDAKTHPVGRKEPNSWSLYDMLGNAWEWVADVWSENHNGSPTDGSARLDGGSGIGPLAPGEVRPLRGGGWCLESAEARFSARSGFGLHQRCNNSGFRVARSLPPLRK
jgi:formylglycine-generating enzyme required for sulfatase activity